MFVAHGIPSFFELLRKCIFNFSRRISLSSNSIITACMTPTVFIHSPIRQWWRSCSVILIIIFLTVIYLFFYCMYVFFIIMFYCIYGQMSEIKN